MDKFCDKCGAKLNDGAAFCSKCANPVNSTIKKEGKSKIGAGLLGILLGGLGIHNFYLGYNSKAVAQLLLTVVGWVALGIGPTVAAVWGLVEGIMILTGSIDKDADGIPLVD
jgi:TM2 domain-containing membrane protein YozV